MNKTGIFFWYGFIINGLSNLKIIKNAGFDSVIFWWGDEFSETFGRKEDLYEASQKIGLTTENVHFPYYGVDDLWRDTLNGNTMFNRYATLIKSCSAYSIKTAVMHLTDTKSPPPVSAIGLKRMHHLVEIAEQYNVTLAVENIEYPSHISEVLAKITSKNLGFCYDSGHHNVAMQDVDLLDRYGDRLKAIHLHDNNGLKDMHQLPYKGTVNWQSVLPKIKTSAYKGALTLETVCRPTDDKSKKEAARYLKQAQQVVKKLTLIEC